MSKNSIFIQIAAYRDPELAPTLDSLFANAEFPDNLTVCICFQYYPEDEFNKDIDKYRKDKRLKILDIPFNEAHGACWARNLIQQEYNNEKYTLQLDSHHRFVKNWDTKLITMYENLQELGHEKPLLTTYATSYDPNNFNIENKAEVWGMKFDRFTPEGVVFFLPYTIEDTSKPLPARFYSAHFVFTTGKHAEEVQHDPSFYFHGEEITLAVRSFTHGYDLFYPNKVIAWHEYTRNGRTKQWDDDSTWNDKNLKCHAKVRSLLNVDGENEIVEEKYGLGNVRSLQEYETYAGIKFKDRAITEKCKDNIQPPGSPDDIYYQTFKEIVSFSHTNFKENDYTFCAVICEDEQNNSLHREDIDGNLFNSGIQSSKEGRDFSQWITYQGPKPHHIVSWAHSESKGWCEKITRVL